MTDGQFWYGFSMGVAVSGSLLAVALYFLESAMRSMCDALRYVARILQEKLP